MALIPNQTKAQTKIYRNLTAGRFIGLIFAIFGGLLFGSFVHNSVRILFMILVPAFYLVMTLRSPTNPKKNLVQSTADYFRYLTGRKHYRSLLGYSFMETVQETERRETENGKIVRNKKTGKKGKAE